MFTAYILPLFLVVVVVTYFTSIACRLALWRHRRVGWRLGLFGAVAAAVVSIAFWFLGLSLQRGETPYFGEFLQLILVNSIGGSLLGIFPAEALVWYYRWWAREHERIA